MQLPWEQPVAVVAADRVRRLFVVQWAASMRKAAAVVEECKLRAAAAVEGQSDTAVVVVVGTVRVGLPMVAAGTAAGVRGAAARYIAVAAAAGSQWAVVCTKHPAQAAWKGLKRRLTERAILPGDNTLGQ